MARFIAGSGAGLLVGWSLGVSGLIPGEGTSLWIMTALGIVLLMVRLTGMRRSVGTS
jgi:hypothetical protein